MQEHQNVKDVFKRLQNQIGLKKGLYFQKLKVLCHKHMQLMILVVKKLQEQFMKKSLKRQINQRLELKK